MYNTKISIQDPIHRAKKVAKGFCGVAKCREKVLADDVCKLHLNSAEKVEKVEKVEKSLHPLDNKPPPVRYGPEHPKWKELPPIRSDHRRNGRLRGFSQVEHQSGKDYDPNRYHERHDSSPASYSSRRSQGSTHGTSSLASNDAYPHLRTPDGSQVLYRHHQPQYDAAASYNLGSDPYGAIVRQPELSRRSQPEHQYYEHPQRQ